METGSAASHRPKPTSSRGEPRPSSSTGEAPTSRQAANVAARPASSKETRTKKLTGLEADFATMSVNRSDDLVENVKLTLAAKLTTFQWKKFVWLLRARAAFGPTQWKRNPRWLALMFGTELGWLWGHLGGARRAMHKPEVIQLFNARRGP